MSRSSKLENSEFRCLTRAEMEHAEQGAGLVGVAAGIGRFIGGNILINEALSLPGTMARAAARVFQSRQRRQLHDAKYGNHTS